jgi:Threonine aldolase
MITAFASDNTAGASEEIMRAIADANKGYAVPYALDDFSNQSDEIFSRIFGDVTVCYTLSGTGANVVALKAMLRPWQGVICADVSHINTEEAGAPEVITGSKLLPVPSYDGKIKTEDIAAFLHDKDSFHRVSPRVVSITQSTEKGTLYSIGEIKKICSFAHENDLLVHMDGSRIANAVAALDCDIKTITKDAGVDVLSFGGSKNGLVFGEAVVFFNKALSRDYMTMRKQSLQLISKMRFVSAQFNEFFKNDLWLKNARHANEMAYYLAEKLQSNKALSVQKPCVNAVFVRMDRSLITKLSKEFYFYVTDPAVNEVRFMCSFQTTKDEADYLAERINTLTK